eukprot:CAMPEP_0170478740 /NCGR_PEP_ID=MMETSP0208-20121228/220_1 /TAXON_ID=197538 /ORGANISM="Strombidium inclinatum, Strain S3" /LENGTH=149 /DNA_ID=CAMNT_0010751047 /DNA_START=688 /DNA_END=1137 /DNA_ORIENTATION=+
MKGLREGRIPIVDVDSGIGSVVNISYFQVRISDCTCLVEDGSSTARLDPIRTSPPLWDVAEGRAPLVTDIVKHDLTVRTTVVLDVFAGGQSQSSRFIIAQSNPVLVAGFGGLVALSLICVFSAERPGAEGALGAELVSVEDALGASGCF